MDEFKRKTVIKDEKGIGMELEKIFAQSQLTLDVKKKIITL